MFLALSGITLPLEDPILKFLLILAIILAAPLVLNKLRIPYLLGLIIAGAVIGPHGFNLVLRDSSIILSGTAGLLYIMFLSGLEMDVNDLRRNGWRSIVFGLYTFSIPMAFGILAGYYILGFALHSSILLAALFASQTLIAYPMVSKLGLARDKSVVIAVGGTMITDTLALLVLTVIVGLSTGKVDQAFWYRLSGSVVACIAGITLLFPLIGRWFFKHCSDNIAQYIFVLMMVFLGAFAAEAAGLEPIIGAFLAGLAMGRLIPRTSPLMNRIDFVGNAIFIPFFLISVGMLIDYRAFFKSWETLEVSAVMVVGVTAAKYLAAVLSQKTFRLSRDQRTLLFGLSSAHVAATLAAVMVGYNVILGHTPEGEPIRLLNESVLNGTILMIFFTCTISTFAAQRGAHNIALSGGRTEEPDEHDERILIPVANDETVEELVHLSTAIKTPRDKGGLFALNSVSNHLQDNGPDIKRAKTALRIAQKTAAAGGYPIEAVLRYDVNTVNAITSVIREQRITDLVMGLHHSQGRIDTFLGNTAQGVLSQNSTMTLIYRSKQPLSTIQRHLVVCPAQAEKEAGFPRWVHRLRNIARNTGARMIFYGTETTLRYIRELNGKRAGEASYHTFDDWDEMLGVANDSRRDDCIWLIMSRKERISYQAPMSRISYYLSTYFPEHSFVLLYPEQASNTEAHYLA